MLDKPDIAELAGRHGRSVAQLSIRHVLQKGMLPLPKSASRPGPTPL
jgi:diketogulonate reductase-like aldo/keto reductase